MKGDLKPWVTLNEQRKKGVSVCLLWEPHIHFYVNTNVFMKIVYSQNKYKYDGNPFLAIHAVCRAISPILGPDINAVI